MLRVEWCLPENLELANGEEEIKVTRRKPSVCQYFKKLRTTSCL